MADMEWLESFEGRMAWMDRHGYHDSVQEFRKLIAAVRLAEMQAHRAAYLISRHEDLHARGMLEELVLRLRSGEVEEKT